MRAVFILLIVFLASSIEAEIALAQSKGSPYFTEDDRCLNVDGATVRIREEGDETAPVIILLHGFTFSLESWDAWAKELKADYRVIRYDLLGHGLSGPDPKRRYAPNERAAFIGKVMDALGIKSAIIGGNSLGGLAAWKFAANSPARVEKLILVAPGGFSINGVTESPVSPPEPVKAFFRGPSRPTIAFTLSRLFVDQSRITEARINLMEHMMMRPGNGEAFIQSIEEFTLPDPTTELRSIEAPTLIMWGEKDSTIPFNHAELFENALQNAILVTFANAAHVPHEELPVESLHHLSVLDK